jgi:uncharacterized protein YgbK (DUF1537 family)
MQRKLIIVADDFTGANDTGVQFRKAGFAVQVIVDIQHLEQDLRNCDVLVVDLESRSDTRESAYEKCFQLGREIIKSGGAIVYKKLDSTFRGNIGAEIDGLMDALDTKLALLAPALPVSGRTVESGEVFVYGTRLSETEAANDPRMPVRTSRIREIIGQQSKRQCLEVPVKMLTGDSLDTNHFLQEAINRNAEIVIFDSLNEKDLERIAWLIHSVTDIPFLLVGSAGLAGQLHKEMILRIPRVGFIFAGSVSEITRNQIRHLLALENSQLFLLPGDELISNPALFYQVLKDVAASIKNNNRRFVFCSSGSRDEVQEVFRISEEKGISREETAEHIASRFGELAARLMEAFMPAGVLLTGGDTAIKTVKALGASGITIDQEIVPGVQCGSLTGCQIKTCVATKAGALGAVDAITKTMDFFNI